MDVVNGDKEKGLRKMIRKGREKFQIPENTNHYSPEHYKLAEKKFIKWCILEGKCSLPAAG
jgi:hypothetical protein